jgi:CheY-like chemotaxis protein
MKSDIPIIALTADVTTVDLEKCKAVGMNDYIAKPVDERLLYNKIVSLVKKPTLDVEQKEIIDHLTNEIKCINLHYLNTCTKSNPVLMMEMISLYLEQTPPLIHAMKQSLLDQDWMALHATVHKMIPSFSIVGINSDFENKARQVQEYASSQINTNGIPLLVSQLENVCNQACNELTRELEIIKKNLK